MKKILQMFSLAAILPFAAQSQITIEANQIKMIGNVAYNGRDTMPDSTIIIGGTGLQNWDFSGLNDDELDTLEFFEAAQLPFASEFPAANVGAKVGQDLNIFFQQNNEHIVTYGSYGSIDYDPFVITTAYKFNPPLTSIRFPMQFNNAFNETAIGTIKLPGSAIGITSDSIRAITTNRRFVSVDAYGELITPFGTFDALRSTEMEVSTDTIYILTNGFWFPYQGSGPDTITLYSWWSNQNGLGFPLVQLTTKNGVVREAGFLKSFVSSTKPASQLLRLGISPNPTSDFINVELPEGHQGRLEVYDMNGKQLQARTVANYQEQLDIQRLPVGSYVLALKDGQGRLVGFERFEVIR